MGKAANNEETAYPISRIISRLALVLPLLRSNSIVRNMLLIRRRIYLALKFFLASLVQLSS